MMLSSASSFEARGDEFRFEILDPLYTKLPLQILNEESYRFEDRFHRTVQVSRLRDAFVWTGAADFKAEYMNNLPAHLQKWLEECFAHWDLDAIPAGFEIPQGQTPPQPFR